MSQWLAVDGFSPINFEYVQTFYKSNAEGRKDNYIIEFLLTTDKKVQWRFTTAEQQDKTFRALIGALTK